MILLLGASGYIGQAFATELLRRRQKYLSLSRRQLDYTRFELILDALKKTKPAFVINAAGFTGKPNVDACETAKAETLQGNTLFPAMLAHACAVMQTPWGHVSSGCIYAGGKVIGDDGSVRIEKDVRIRNLGRDTKTIGESLGGFTEMDAPNFSFRDLPCSFYSGTKALAEEAIAGVGESYLWRLRIPFDQFDNSRNYLSKVQRYAKVYDNVNSITHRADFVRACLDLWECRAPSGIYNVINPGAVTTRQVVGMIRRILKLDREFEFWASDEEFYHVAAKTPRSNCVLDVSKLLATGVGMRPVDEALEDSLRNWKPE